VLRLIETGNSPPKNEIGFYLAKQAKIGVIYSHFNKIKEKFL